MALTRNGFRTGRAGASDLADQREMIHEATIQEHRQRIERDKKEETALMLEMIEKYGDAFVGWYDSPEVPLYGSARSRIELIKKWEAGQPKPSLLEGVTAPVVGYVQENRVNWNTDEVPATYRAVWDDSPDSVTFVKQTALREQGGGQEAMKKPAETIIP